MPVTYSSDHDWEKHTSFDIENLFGTNSENDDINSCFAISAIHVPSNDDMFTNEHTLEDNYSIAYDDIYLQYMMIAMMNMIFSVHLILFMMLLKVIMREGNMVLCVSTILSFPSLC